MSYNKLIDHTLLKQDAQPEQIVKLCEEAKEYDFMSVCVNPAYVPLAAECLKGSDVKVCTVIEHSSITLSRHRSSIKFYLNINQRGTPIKHRAATIFSN